MKQMKGLSPNINEALINFGKTYSINSEMIIKLYKYNRVKIFKYDKNERAQMMKDFERNRKRLSFIYKNYLLHI